MCTYTSFCVGKVPGHIKMLQQTNFFRISENQKKTMLLGFLCLLNLNVLVNSNENTNDKNTKKDLGVLNGLDENVRSKMSSLIYFYSSNAAAHSSNADFILNKFTRAMMYVEKATHLELFDCALSHMKSTTDYSYELFELKHENLEAKDKIEYPVGFENHYIKSADRGSYGNINIYYLLVVA